MGKNTIEASCHNCGKRFSAPVAYAGRKAKCPKCQALFTIPLLPFQAQIPSSPTNMLGSETIKHHVFTSASKTKKCPHCGEIILDAAIKCTVCDKFLDEVRKLETNKIEVSCLNCGKQLYTPMTYTEKAVRCPDCGNLLAIPEVASQSQVVQPVEEESSRIASTSKPTKLTASQLERLEKLRIHRLSSTPKPTLPEIPTVIAGSRLTTQYKRDFTNKSDALPRSSTVSGLGGVIAADDKVLGEYKVCDRLIGFIVQLIVWCLIGFPLVGVFFSFLLPQEVLSIWGLIDFIWRMRMSFIIAAIIILPIITVISTLTGCYTKYQVKVMCNSSGVLDITKYIFGMAYFSRRILLDSPYSVSSDFDKQYIIRCSSAGQQGSTIICFGDDEKEFEKFLGFLQRALKGDV